MLHKVTLLNTVTTAIEYVGKDMFKKQKVFIMRAITVFLTVSFITLMMEMSGLSLLPALLQAKQMVGHYDLIIKQNPLRLKFENSNANFFNDESEQF